MQPPVIAITGAGGLIGGALVRHLRDQGRRVIPIVRGREARHFETHCEADITQAEHMPALVGQGFRADVMVHLAGRIEVAFRPDPAGNARCLPDNRSIGALYQSNVTGVANIVDLARAAGIRKFVFASSQTVYGYGVDGGADEATPPAPLEHYATSKVCAETLLRSVSQQDMDVTILRFPGIFAAQRRTGVVHSMCRAAVHERRIIASCPAPIAMDVLALEDLIPGIAAAIDHPGGSLEVFNLSYGQPCSLTLLAERISSLVPGCTVIAEGPPQPPFQMRAGRAVCLLHWHPAALDQRLHEILRNSAAND